MVGLAEAGDIADSLEGRDRQLVERQRLVESAPDVRDHAEIIGGVTDGAIVARGRRQRQRPLELRLRLLQQPQLEGGGAQHVDGATVDGGVGPPLQRGDDLPEQGVRLRQVSGAQVRLGQQQQQRGCHRGIAAALLQQLTQRAPLAPGGVARGAFLQGVVDGSRRHGVGQ